MAETTCLPNYETLLVRQQAGILTVTLNRPDRRNAMNLVMVRELMSVFSAIATDRTIRAVVLQGSAGHFCAGGDINDMRHASQAQQTTDRDPIFDLNRAFGHLITQVNASPHVVIALLEGSVMGGGFGLACVSDIAIAAQDAQFRLPETRLGIPPAQIAPFVVTRIGLTQARRLVLTGANFGAEEALKLGVVHFVANEEGKLQTLLQQQIEQLKRCAPHANATTKQILLDVGSIDQTTLLDQAAAHFSDAVNSTEGKEGAQAFIEKRLPAWAQ